MSESIERLPNLVVRRDQLQAASRITPREWLVHSSLFLLTLLTTTLAGIILVAPELPAPEAPLQRAMDYILYVPRIYTASIAEIVNTALSDRHALSQGLIFSVSLLAILAAHEMGHYLVCRLYRVNATLPFFIPAPPLFLAGTFGAFIKIRAAIPSRRALFDIGLAGPIAGFVVAVPVAIIGILHTLPPVASKGSEIIFNDPLLFRLLAKLLGVHLDPYSPINPYYMAAWIGLLVTSLNLMPIGQLDGGHGTFAVFGERSHRLIGRLSFLAMAILAVLGFLWHGSPSGFIYCVLLAIMLKVRHPQPAVMEPLGKMRTAVSVITLVVFFLCFWPFPFTLT
jgi:membrane-associated protease RseP (regulator of RpoE activity)